MAYIGRVQKNILFAAFRIDGKLKNYQILFDFLDETCVKMTNRE